MAIRMTDTAIEHLELDIEVLNLWSVDPSWDELWLCGVFWDGPGYLSVFVFLSWWDDGVNCAFGEIHILINFLWYCK